jgi:hypothetical protein
LKEALDGSTSEMYNERVVEEDRAGKTWWEKNERETKFRKSLGGARK